VNLIRIINFNIDKMKNQIQALFLTSFLILLVQSAVGVSAYPYPVEVTQSDGSTITVLLKGDEHIRWAETVDGYSIMRNSSGIFEYAKTDSKIDMIPSGVKVRNLSERSSSDIQFLSGVKKHLTYSVSQLGMMKSISMMTTKKDIKTAAPTTGTRKLLCILVGFTDKRFKKTQSDFNNLFNQVNYSEDGATGSVYDFYKENSWGQLDLSVTVAGPYTASHNMVYYGGNTVSGDDTNPRELVNEAVNLANADVNYADYDNDGDGVVDGIYVIYAGYGEEAGASENAIWAHAWSISPIELDGKTVYSYSCSPELRGNTLTGLTRIGVICHEFGHVMGAADYYDTDYSTNGSYTGTGNWDIMAGGSWNNDGATPAHHNPYTKIFDYGWAEAITLASGTTASVTLANAELNGNSFYRINTATANEFFLIENRQQQLFDVNIPSHGMVIYHVDENYISSAGNKINAGSHQGMYPVCAGATGNPPTIYGTINSGVLPFPGLNNVTSFTDATVPSSLSWDGSNTNKPITNITENTTDKTVSFDYIVNTTAPTAITAAASGIMPTEVTLNAQVGANIAATTVTFEYGLTTDYGFTISGTPNEVTGSDITSISAHLTGLTSNTTYNYRVVAVNSEGTTLGSNMTFSPVWLTLPVTENFAVSTMPTGWDTQNIGDGITESWSLSNTANAGGEAYELKCLSKTVEPSPGITRFITPAINTLGVSSIDLSFKHKFIDWAPGATLRIQSSTDKITWTDEIWSLASASNRTIGPETVNTIITNNLNSETTFIAIAVIGDLYQFDKWYLDDISLTVTTLVVPTVNTTVVSTVSSTEATSGGEITYNGGSEIIESGVCWGTAADPTIEINDKTTEGSNTDAFSSSITGLVPGTIYYIRAYATNSIGTGYGDNIQFTLGTAVLPTVVTSAVTGIISSDATGGGTLIFDGCDAITAKGICWSTAADPTIELITKTLEGTGSDAFTSSISGLTYGTTYHVRAYATNSVGTAYGLDEIFTTTTFAAVTTTDVSAIWPTTAISGGVITSDGGTAVTAKGVCWSTSADPTIDLSTKTINGTGSGTYTSYISELALGTTYHLRAYVTMMQVQHMVLILLLQLLVYPLLQQLQ